MREDEEVFEGRKLLRTSRTTISHLQIEQYMKVRKIRVNSSSIFSFFDTISAGGDVIVGSNGVLAFRGIKRFSMDT